METKETIIARLKTGSTAFNAWRTANPEIPIDLSNSDLSGMDLSKCYLMNTNMENANLSNTTCAETVFCSANLSGAKLKIENFLGGGAGRGALAPHKSRPAKLY